MVYDIFDLYRLFESVKMLTTDLTVQDITEHPHSKTSTPGRQFIDFFETACFSNYMSLFSDHIKDIF